MRNNILLTILFLISLNSFSQKRTYVYDELQRLKVTNYWQGNVIVSSVEYTYDEVGNRLVKDVTGECPAPTASISGTQSINQGQSANLTLTLTGAAPWTVVVNGQTYSNIVSSPHVISVTPSATTTYSISSVTNKCGAGTFSGSAIVSVCIPATATISGTQTINNGQSANISVALTGTSPWSIVVNGQTYANITTSPKIITVSPTTTTTYSVSSVSNSCGTGTASGSAEVTVCNKPTGMLTGTQTINLGQSADLSVALTGDSPWTIQINGQTYSNIVTSPFVVSVTPNNTTNYALISVSNACGGGVAQGMAAVTVCKPATATITGTQAINNGQSANISVALTGTSPWSIVVNGQTYSNITTSPKVISVSPNTTTTYTVSSVSNPCGNGTASGSAVVTICNPATASIIGTQTINQGQSASLPVALTGDSPWSIMVNGQTYSNITSSPKVITVTPTTTTTYTVSSVSNACGNGTSSGSAIVTVCNPATATISGTQTINIGQSATLSIALTGNSPYSFKVNGQTYSNIGNSPYLINVSPSTTTTYTVTNLSNSCGAGTTSGSAVVTVNTTVGCDPNEGNDSPATATVILGNSYVSPDLCLDVISDVDWYKWSFAGKNYYFKVQSYANATAGNYKFQLSLNGNDLVFETKPMAGSNLIDTHVFFYDSDASTLIASNDDIGGDPWSYFSKIAYSFPVSCADKPDLQITDIPITEYQSNQIKYIVKIKNNGGVSASLGSVSLYTYTSIDATYNSTNDRFINGLFIGGNLAAGQTMNLNWSGSFKYDNHYYLIGVIDYHGLLTECIETNNTFSKLVTPCTASNLNLTGIIAPGFYSTNGVVQITGNATSTDKTFILGRAITTLPNFTGQYFTMQTGQCLPTSNTSLFNVDGTSAYDKTKVDKEKQKINQGINSKTEEHISVLEFENENGNYVLKYNLAVEQNISISVWSDSEKNLQSSILTNSIQLPGLYTQNIDTSSWEKGNKYLIHLDKGGVLDVLVVEW
ncbi:hypothetical protein EGI22_08255 [Lacihabitans sp. LS3-19]|uniref:CARDB domain-containing protein n=1 Tax=Lacihabitans sp. LS3-19 TaxID=2487335 RepID=UPI0020CF5CB5|nr:CARDB domain-containing protein [Lacihabitans sp. LS3-19]MCP9767902.1 hypothetical protein [Lacihabitans sp. LS3-19]